MVVLITTDTEITGFQNEKISEKLALVGIIFFKLR